jgi:hypothetical protein
VSGETPAGTIRRAASLMRKRAEEATPGPWERPLDTRHKSIVGAALPEGEEGRYINGVVPGYLHGGYTGRYIGQRERVEVVQCNTWSDGTHVRKRNGRDLEYIAAMHPVVALAVAGWLESLAGIEWSETGPTSDELVHALRIARVYLGERTP